MISLTRALCCRLNWGIYTAICLVKSVKTKLIVYISWSNGQNLKDETLFVIKCNNIFNCRFPMKFHSCREWLKPCFICTEQKYICITFTRRTPKIQNECVHRYTPSQKLSCHHLWHLFLETFKKKIFLLLRVRLLYLFFIFDHSQRLNSFFTSLSICERGCLTHVSYGEDWMH